MTGPTTPLPMPGPGARFIAIPRSPDVEDGLAARLADPLWMLARQWQLGEFRGDDAGSLIALDFQANAHLPTWWRPEPDAEHPQAQPWRSWTVADGPLEVTIDAEPDDGTGYLRLRVDGGVAARRALCAAGLTDAANLLLNAGKWATNLIDQASPLDSVVMSSTPDPVALDAFISPWSDPGVPMPAAAIAQLGISTADAEPVAGALRSWQTWWRARSTGRAAGPGTGPVDPPAWDASRLEYRGSLGFASAPDVRLQIDRHPGGPLDWYSADIVATTATDLAGTPPVPPDLGQVRTFRAPAIPQPARLPGMPALRFWEYEDAQVDFGHIDAAPADLARLLLVDYTTVYDHNWYYAPIRVPVGALVEVPDGTPSSVTVTDSFGITVPLDPMAERFEGNTRMFTPTGLDAPQGGARADGRWSTRWFWFAPRLAATLDSAAVERVSLRRDEAANLGWAITDSVSDSLGRARTGRSAPPSSPTTAGGTAAPDDAVPVFSLQSPLPGTWRALIPQPIDPGDPNSAYLLVLAAQAPADAGELPPCRLLAAGYWAIHEEELGDAGLTLTRTRTLGRWYGGKLFGWTGRIAWPGGGAAASGLTWDYLRDND